jgi:predicted DCC family thiol-disulfide oxidoreductase YuxK
MSEALARHTAQPAARPSTIRRIWDQIWFQDRPTTQLELVRIGLGFALVCHYGWATGYLFDIWSDRGWFPTELIKDNPSTDASLQSVLFYLTQPWQLALFHIFFLASCAAFMLGWRTNWVKWIVLIGHLSYAQRAPDVTYGVHSVAASLLFLLCLAPIGKALSFDRARAVAAVKRFDLNATLPVYTSRWAFACRRLMQLQMAVLFFFSAVHKVRENEWWDGDAIWRVFTAHDYYSGGMLDFLSSQFWLVNVATYGVVLIEIAYPFMIWQRLTRGWLLAGAVFIHLLFFFFLGLHYFSFVMIMGHVSFLRQDWLERLGRWWKRRTIEMEMVYDGRCKFCVRSMAWFLGFDNLNQIKTRDFRTNPSPVVTDEEMEKALHLVLPDGRALPGFEAYRYVVLRVPGMWWQVPFFYIPFLSRMIGHPVYNWVATNRSKL